MRFHTLDVFTRDKFSGKALALFESDNSLAQDVMAALAREFNLPAAFLLAPRDPVNSARLRVFSARGEERRFSAQALIGAAIFLARSRASEILARREVVVVLEMPEGVYSCEVIQARDGACYAQFALDHASKTAGEALGADKLAAVLALMPHEIGFLTHAPRIYAAAWPFIFVPVGSRAALSRARPSPSRFQRFLGEAAGAYLYTADTILPDSAIHARLFGHGGVEDPASGAAVAAFAGVAREFERPEDGEHQLFIEQGYAMGRPSRLTLRMNVVGGALIGVQIGGQAVEVTTGELRP